MYACMYVCVYVCMYVKHDNKVTLFSFYLLNNFKWKQ